MNSLLRYHGTLSTRKNYNARICYNSYPVHRTVHRTFRREEKFAGLRTALGVIASRGRAMTYRTIVSNSCFLLGRRRGVILAMRSVARLGRMRERLGITGRGTRGTSVTGSTFLTGVDRRVHAPLGTVAKFTRMVNDTGARRRGARCRRVVGVGTSLLVRLMGSVLSVSGVRTNALRFICSAMSVGLLLSSLRELFRVEVGSTKKGMRVVTRPSLSSYFVRASHGQITRIVSGFINGTVGFAQRKGVHVNCRTGSARLCFCIGSANANVPTRGLSGMFKHFIGLGGSRGNTKLKLSVSRAVMNGLDNRVKTSSVRKRNSAF